MVNWKTTLGGVLTAVGLYLVGETNPILHLIGQILGPLGAFLIGAMAKDKNVTGGPVQNDIR